MRPLLVIHESITDYVTTLSQCQSTNQLGSYHCLIVPTGGLIHLAQPHEKCYGAGLSHFNGESICDSVDPFSYHVCLITPPGVARDALEHSGYTDAQYMTLAWLISHTGLPWFRVTTHKDVDLTGTVIDPRSLDMSRLLRTVNKYGSNKTLYFDIDGE